MAATYLINGQSPQHYGVVVAKRQLVNQGVDVLSMVIDRPVDGTVPFTYDQAITVTRDGIPFFQGRVMTRLVEGQVAYEGMRIDVGGVWWMLSRLPYVKLTLETTGEKTTRFRWGLSAGTQQTSLQLINQVFDYAIAKGVALQTETFTLDEYKPPRITKMDRRCDDLIRSALMCHPDVALWFDYSTTPPTARLTKRGAVGAVMTYAVGTPPLATMAPLPRPDLVPSGVVYRYEKSGLTVSTNGMRPAWMIDKWPADCEPDVLDAITTTVTLAKGQVAFAGTAKRLYDSLSVMPWEGGITLQAEDCVSGVRPGLAINITGGQADWETMRAFVQTVDEDLHTGVTSIGFGLPQYYGKGPTLLHITRLPHNDREKDGPGAGEGNELEDLDVPSGNLVPYLAVSGVDYVIRVTPGVYNDGDPGGGTIFTMNGTPLNAATPPELVINPGDSIPIYAFVEVEPAAQSFSLTDADGDPFVEYRAMSTGTLIEASISSTQFPGNIGTVDPEDGTVLSHHKVYKYLGQAVWNVGATAPELTPNFVGDLMIAFFPPSSIYLLPSNG